MANASLEPEGKIVEIYQTECCTIKICDAAFAGRTEEELERVRWEARQIAHDIVVRAARRGIPV